MIVLDTNIISEVMQSKPDASVMEWLDAQPSESIWTTSISVYEILYGIQLLAKGKRRTSLNNAFEKTLQQDLKGRVLDFDLAAATEAAAISVNLRSQGRPIDIRDIQIAGIIAARHGTLATRNTKHFADTGLALINPWEDGS